MGRFQEILLKRDFWPSLGCWLPIRIPTASAARNRTLRRFRKLPPIRGFGTHAVAGLEFLSPSPGKPETGGWVEFRKFDQNVILGPEEVASFEYVSPRPGQPENGCWLDFRKFDQKVILGPDGVAGFDSYYHGLGNQTPEVRSISGNSTKT